MRALKVLTTVASIGLGVDAFAADPLYSVSAKDRGMPFDLVATETKREAQKSYLSVPGFHKRTAAGSRWLMCAYTDLAIKRGFTHWTAVYPDESNDIVVVGFFKSENADVPGTLGGDFVAARAIPPKPASVEVMATRLCGMRR
jgi:hypothetical protein